jgi:anti-sigma factor RsiW
MNRATHDEIQEMLPDLLHGSLDAETRQRIEAHVASCDACSADLAALRTVKSAAVFAPSINVDQIVRQIPPYRMIVPGVERPARTRAVAWVVAAALVIATVAGGSLLFPRQTPSRVVSINEPGSTKIAQVSPQIVNPPVTVTTPGTAAAAPGPYALVSATDLGELTDGSLVLLMNDMDDFDALPAPEPEPVISVDNGDSL